MAHRVGEAYVRTMTPPEALLSIERLAIKAGELAVEAERLQDESTTDEAEEAADILRAAEHGLLKLSGSRRQRA